jgi:cysteine synthase A
MDHIKKICGNTPLIKLSDKIYAKFETYNPSGSIKDRIITYVVSKALDAGEIDSNTILCDATSGNTGISLSMVAASAGLGCVIFMPSNMSEERKQMMKAYGAMIIEAPPDDFIRAIEMRDEFLVNIPNAWSPKQFSNEDNIECHLKTTAPEIHADLEELNLSWSAFVHGSGTGGTIEGVRRYIRDNCLATKTIMVKPRESPHGIQGIADGKEFLAYEDDMNRVMVVSTEKAIERAERLAKEHGLLVGISSGANVAMAEEWVAAKNPSGVVVTILCDRGERYMSVFNKK